MLIAEVTVASKAEVGTTESLRMLVKKKPHLSSIKGCKDKVRVTFYDVADQEAFSRAANQLNLTPVFQTVTHNQGKQPKIDPGLQNQDEDYRSEYGG